MIPMRTPSSGGLTLFGVDSTLTCTINNLSEGFYVDFVFLRIVILSLAVLMKTFLM